MSSPADVSHGTNDKLVYMANQIGEVFQSQDIDSASAKIAKHITKFWDARMRRAILPHLDASGTGLDPAVRRPAESLRSVSPNE